MSKTEVLFVKCINNKGIYLFTEGKTYKVYKYKSCGFYEYDVRDNYGNNYVICNDNEELKEEYKEVFEFFDLKQYSIYQTENRIIIKLYKNGKFEYEIKSNINDIEINISRIKENGYIKAYDYAYYANKYSEVQKEYEIAKKNMDIAYKNQLILVD